MEKFLHREVLGKLQEERGDYVDVLRTVLVPSPVRLVEHLVVPGHLVDPFRQRVPLPGRYNPGGDPAVLARVRPQRNDQRGVGAHPRHVLTQLPPQQRRMRVRVVSDQRLLRRYVDVLSHASVGEIPVIKRGQYPNRRVLRPGIVAVLVSLPHRRLVRLPGDLHVPAGRHHHQVVARVIGPLSRGPERRHRRQHQPGVIAAQVIVSDPSVGQVMPVVALNDHVGVRGQAAEQPAPRLGLQIQRD